MATWMKQHAGPRKHANATLLFLVVLEAVAVDLGLALRGLGLPNRELFMDGSERLLLADSNSTTNATRTTTSPSTTTTTSSSSDTSNTTGLTLSGLKEELGGLKDKVEDERERHSKATIAVAATFGSLMLVSALGFAGMWAYRRFASSQHSSRKKGRAADKLPYYDADRLLGDAAGL